MFRNKMIQTAILLTSPILIIPTVLSVVENSIDRYYQEKKVKEGYRKQPATITNAGIVKIFRGKGGEREISTKEEVKFVGSWLRGTARFQPKIEFKYVLDGKTYRSSYSFFKRKEFKKCEQAKDYLVNALGKLKNNTKNQIHCFISPKNANFSRIIDPSTTHMLGYSSGENLRKLQKGVGGLFGLSGLLGVCYWTGSEMARMMGRKILGYGSVINIILVGLTLRKRYTSDFFSLTGEDISGDNFKEECP